MFDAMKRASQHYHSVKKMFQLMASRRIDFPGNTRWPSLVVLAMCFGVSLFSESRVIAQRRPVVNVPAPSELRYELFQMLMEEQSLGIVNLYEALESPARSVVVVIGNRNILSRQLQNRIDTYVEQGGAVLVASAQQFDSQLGRIRTGPAKSRNPVVQFQSLEDCLRIRTINYFHPLMSGIHEIVVNRTGWIDPIEDSRFEGQAVALLPIDCTPLSSREKPLITVVETDPTASQMGKAVLVADSSLLSNSMLWHADNAILAIRVANYLAAERTGLCFIVESQQLPTYRSSPLLAPQSRIRPQVNPESMPLPEMDAQTLLALANAVIVDVEESNIFNETLKNQPRNLRPDRYGRALTALAVAITVVGLCWILVRRRAMRASLPSLRKFRSAHEVSLRNASADRQRQLAVEALARELFRDITGANTSADWKKYLDDLRTRSAHGFSSTAHQIQLSNMLTIAVDGFKEPISKESFVQLGTNIRQLRELYAVKTMN